MRRHLQRIFFHMGFWPRAFARWVSLLFSSDFLKVTEIGIDQAFYIEGSWVRLNWKVENSWLVRVNHPGGFYLGSDMTWFVAEQGMDPIRITLYGLRKHARHAYIVHVKPFPRTAAALSHLQVSLDTAAVHAGPILRAPAARFLRHPIQFKESERPMSNIPGQAGTAERILQAVHACKDHAALDALRQQHFPDTQSSNPSHG